MVIWRPPFLLHTPFVFLNHMRIWNFNSFCCLWSILLESMCGFKIDWNVNEMQSDFIKYCCLLYLWNSQVTDGYYLKPDVQTKAAGQTGRISEKDTPLADPCNVFLSSLYIKLGLLKQFAKNTREGTCQKVWLYCVKVSQNYTGEIERGYHWCSQN